MWLIRCDVLLCVLFVVWVRMMLATSNPSLTRNLFRKCRNSMTLSKALEILFFVFVAFFMGLCAVALTVNAYRELFSVCK